MRLTLKLILGTLLFFSLTSTPLLWSATDQTDPAPRHFTQRLHNQWIDLLWMSDRPEPESWKVSADSSDASSEWFSMSAPSIADTSLTRHLRLHGKIGNLSVESTGHWLPGDKANQSRIAVYQRRVGKGLLLEQSYALTETPYHLNMTITLRNASEKIFEPHTDDRMKLSLGPGLGDQRSEGLGYADAIYSFVEAVALIEDRVERFSAQETGTVILPWSNPDLRWWGLHGRYFALLVAPAAPQDSKTGTAPDQMSIHLEKDESAQLPLKHLPVLSVDLPVNAISPGDSMEWNFVVFSGPKSMQALQKGSQGFENLVFPGMWQWMRGLSFGLLRLMTALHAVIPDWGIVILVLAVLVRLAMYPIAKKALASQKAFVRVQKRIQPELQIIKRDYRGEEQSERILQLYEQHGVSPLAGLKPLFIVLLQLPILIALFHVLGAAYELRSASFLWIETLAEPDRLFALGFTIPLLGEYFNVLPVIMALSTLASLKLSPTPAPTPSAQRVQNIGLLLIASVFFILFYPFPAGMVLYWTAANVLHIAQQKLL